MYFPLNSAFFLDVNLQSQPPHTLTSYKVKRWWLTIITILRFLSFHPFDILLLIRRITGFHLDEQNLLILCSVTNTRHNSSNNNNKNMFLHIKFEPLIDHSQMFFYSWRLTIIFDCTALHFKKKEEGEFPVLCQVSLFADGPPVLFG